MKYSSFALTIATLLTAAILSGCGREEAPNSQAVLQKLATISPERAEALALQQAGGTVKQQELELENGLLVYSFDIQTPDNRIMEVQINAKDGSLVLKKEETAESEKTKQAEEHSGEHAAGQSQREQEFENQAEEQNEAPEMEQQTLGAEEGETQQGSREESEKENSVAAQQENEAQEKHNEFHIRGTIPVKKDTDLTSLAKISEQRARTAALNLVEGTAEKVELENEDGFLVYVVEVKFKGDEYEVLVDAGNAKVLSIEAD